MKSLHSFFEKQARLAPAKIALICNSTEFTFKFIDEASNQIAHWLLAQGIKSEDIIGVLMDLSPEIYIVMLGILKAGAAYLPIDVKIPAERIQHIVKDSNMALLFTSTSDVKYEFSESKVQIFSFNTLKQVLDEQPKEGLISANFSSDNLCFIVYTSGTTGIPKGVAITHKAMCNYIEAALKIFGVTDQDKIYQGFTLSFDASMEEIWLAFAGGGTLITTSSEAVREGPALEDFLNFHKITVFSTVPTMLTMLEPPLPYLKVLILGGEIVTEELVAPWFRSGLRIFNTYGPSEATIISTYLECQPNEDITIGKPIPNCEILILDENLHPVEEMQEGEIFIGGEGLARGYLNNPDLTAEKFIKHPRNPSKRLYRTGDMGCFTENGDINFITRLDQQVKLRGFRIELKGIESHLRKIKEIRNAAVVIKELTPGIQTLVAYLVLRKDAAVSTSDIEKSLGTVLPKYMIPSLFKIIPSFPRMLNGKIDRDLLPNPDSHEMRGKSEYVAPTSETERKITAIWENILKISPISINADLFAELGGNSLSAAKIISEIRSLHPEMGSASLLDIFENSTIEKLAAQIKEVKEPKEKPKKSDFFLGPTEVVDKMQYYMCAFVQGLLALILITISPWHFLIITLISVIFAYNYFAVLPWYELSFYFFGLLFILEPALISFSIAVKWLLLGRIKPGKYKLWSWYYLRWWIVNQVQDLAPIDHLVGSPFINVYCKLMGAKIGKNCYINTDVFNAFDLFSMGDNSSLCADVVASGYKVEKGWLIIGSIKIGENCFVGANSVLSINTQLKNGSKLGEHSLLAAGQIISEDESYIGSPARPGVIDLPNMHSQPVQPSFFRSYFHLFSQYFLLMLIEITYLLAAAPAIILIVYICYITKAYINCLWAIPLAAVSYIFLLLTLIALLKKVVGPIKKGTYSLNSFSYLKIWFCERLVGLSLGTMEALYGTIYSTSWFRLLGAKIGKNSEIATINFSLPDLIRIGKESFIGDNTILAPVRVYKGCINLSSVYLGDRVFIGNGSVVPGNTKIEDNCLIAAASLSPAHNVPGNTSWIGSPSVPFPRLNTDSVGLEEKTYHPSVSAKIIRGVFDFLKIFLPAVCLFFILSLDVIVFVYLKNMYSVMIALLIFPFLAITYLLLEIFFIIALKWILIGVYVERSAPMWSSFVYRAELVTGLYDNVIVPFVLEALLGSPYISIFLRLLGMKIDKYTFINTPYFSEFDLVSIGEGVCLNRDTTIQTHLYEDRVFKMSTITIDSGCSVSDRSILLYDTVMNNYSMLGNLSLLMKGETLTPFSEWEGIPARRKD